VRSGLALPQYDFSVSGENPLGWPTVAAHARRAEELGFDSLWLSDHLFFDVEKYGAGPGRYGAFEPLTTLAALARTVTRPRLGTLVLCEALRPATMLAKALASLDNYCGGRLDVGIGAGWYEPDYEALGSPMPPAGERLARLGEALEVLDGFLSGGPFTYDGRYHRAREAPNHPSARQSPRPPVFVGGKGDRLLRLVAERADGWNTCWAWTPDAYRERLGVLEGACAAVGRQPATVSRSLGLYALVGWTEDDLEHRFQRMRELAPGGMLDSVSLDQWREGRLVGTTQEAAEQVAGWEKLGIETLIVSLGPLPFSVCDLDDLLPLAAALGLSGG
jgi:alkanesulfonate monooxygenase SsuD/methylene tetrahydromethanopterin reductase-like flavin-dependent oxidoreductase (luciferase family)